ncbi:HipA N-terminal domain-containing protein [Galbibacter sp. EGI 63066]|uniref:HipA N-terminal domain-containing protein n=1 Tax=Galbibacter sp. EGI 63066 TaxID=2993559 RepID=UPI0022494466|nr:HipA N-terminal domain-containing protein [Galbibacter sp. EGI 63066]MCX2680695.1 HipA N-terminal domain-containing protein [Galbibacter sp. EGI 63066]
MRQAEVIYKKELAGILTQLDDGSFIFRYHDLWYNNSGKPAISLTLPKRRQEYTSEFLFPFFYNMLPEGSNKQVVCFELRIDPKDEFGLLLATARFDTIGAIQIKKID